MAPHPLRDIVGVGGGGPLALLLPPWSPAEQNSLHLFPLLLMHSTSLAHSHIRFVTATFS